MNIFNKYRSHAIATLGTFAISLLLVLLFFTKPFGDSNSLSPDDLAEQEMAIQFKPEMIEDIRMPQPNNTQTTTEESTRATQTTSIPTPEDVDQDPGRNEESVMPANIDSVLITELKKAMEEIKDKAPDDSLQKEELIQKNIQQAKQTKAEKAREFNEDRQFYYDNYRAIYNLRKVYPYVQRTKLLVDKMNADLAKITDKSEKKRLIKQAEKELFAQFEKDVRNMSTSQGKLLLKLIARETNETAFGLIKTYKGAIPATFWYGVGLIFKENLKMGYDSIGEDAQLEKVVQKFKLGKL
ncbi:MAG: DUF4294 domain-containing protein [Paludibacter sp.]|nr:DUF4294 domain-containing protein [Paludibacter sp.]